MLFARALTRGARRFAPGIFGGAPIYTPDELGAETDNEGYTIVDTVVTPATDTASYPPQGNEGEGEIIIEEIELEEDSPDPQAVTNGQLKRLHVLGKDLYGDDWKVRRAELVHAVSKGAATSSGNLTTNEAKKLIDGMEAKIAKRDSEQPEMSFMEHAAATEQSAYSEG